MADSGYKSISRNDSPRKKTHGWQVRVWFKGILYTKFFNDNFYASPEDALEDAIIYRDELEAELGKRRSEKPVITDNPRKPVDFIRVGKTVRQTGAFVPYTSVPNLTEVYETVWREKPGKFKRRTFSIAKYGEEGALKRANRLRDKLVERFKDLPEEYYD